MAIYTKHILSGTPASGRQIKVATTSSTGTTIHTADASATDEIWIYATNSSTADINLTIEFGGTTDPDDLIQLSVPGKAGLTLIIPGLILTGGLVVSAYAGSADVIMLSGYVNRITT